jgi:hypothetical protein
MSTHASWQSLRLGQMPPLVVFIGPLLFAGFFYFFFLRFLFDLVDEVWDDGEALVIRNGTKEERIALSDIMNVNYTVWPNPERVTLLLRRQGVFGREISFYPPARIKFFSKSPIVDDLIERIETKRSR